ncbi:MAG TPA: hypothetical protein VFF43_01000, partial [Caldimonas sp.]|nr:hypothetical protein [Caldimonas sp.]
MIYLSGGLSPSYVDRYPHPRLGYMLTFPKASRGDRTSRPFAFDNGCFANPTAYDDDKYLAWLDRRERSGCLFATAPDVVGDWRATLARATPMLARIRALGYPVAFVAQDGLDVTALDWNAFDVIFVGGSTAYKLSESAYALPALAHSYDKRAHMGRVNSRIR